MFEGVRLQNVLAWPDDLKAALWVCGAIHDLQAEGVLTRLTLLEPRGIAAYDQLRASGWKPSRADVWLTLRAMEFVGQRLREIGRLLIGYRDRKPVEVPT